MAQITLNIPDPYVPRLLTAIKSLWTILEILNPDYEEFPENLSLYDYDTPQYINKFSDVAWAKIKIRDFLADTLKKYETRRDQNIARNAVDIPEDLVS